MRLAAFVGLLIVALAVGGCAADEPKPAPPAERCATAVPSLTRSAVVPMSGAPADVAADPGGAWVALSDRGAIGHIDSASRRRDGRLVDVGRSPIAVALGYGRVWVADRDGPGLVAVDPVRRKKLRAAARIDLPTDVAVGAGYVWVTSLDDGYVGRVSPNNIQIGPTPLVPGRVVSRVAVGGDTVWVGATADHNLARIDPASGRLLADPIDPQLRSITALAAGPDSLWVADGVGSVLRRVERRGDWVPGVRVRTVREPRDLALAGCVLYVAGADGLVAALDASTGRPLRTPVRIGRSAASLAVAGDTLWVTDPRGRALVALRVSAR